MAIVEERGSEGAPKSLTTVEDEIARLDQALVDLEFSEASSISLHLVPTPTRELALAREFSKVAAKRHFVFAQLSLGESGLNEVNELVASLLDALVGPERSGSRQGLLSLLELFAARHGALAPERFAHALAEQEANGDLSAIAQAYLVAEDDAAREVRAFERWAQGTLSPRQVSIPGVHHNLNEHTAQRVLAELTRVIRALGYAGLLVCFVASDALTQRTVRQRERAYTVLRELVDNFDSGSRAVSTRLCFFGGHAFFFGSKSIQSLPPLAARLECPSQAEPPPPHRTWTSVVRDPYNYVHRPVRRPESVKPRALRALIRLSQGLPPTDAVASMSVGHERIDKTIAKLFAHAEAAGSVFTLLSGDYGSGKTHILLHFAERALEANHPVFWLNLERMNLDLGNPQKHLERVLEQSTLPVRGRPSAADRARHWTRNPRRFRALVAELEAIAEFDSEEAHAAKKAVVVAQSSKDPARGVEALLLARDLRQRGSGKTYRQDAYRRLLLWCELLRRLEGLEGPVLLIDEAENLYSSGVSVASRRAALRALSFYCGGSLPHACVVLAMTPPSLAELRAESRALLGEIEEGEGTLALEQVALFQSRLSKLVVEQVPAFSRAMRVELAERVRLTHRSVRGPLDLPEWSELVEEVVRQSGPPRVLMRRLVDELEAVFWGGRSRNR